MNPIHIYRIILLFIVRITFSISFNNHLPFCFFRFSYSWNWSIKRNSLVYWFLRASKPFPNNLCIFRRYLKQKKYLKRQKKFDQKKTGIELWYGSSRRQKNLVPMSLDVIFIIFHSICYKNIKLKSKQTHFKTLKLISKNNQQYLLLHNSLFHDSPAKS